MAGSWLDIAPTDEESIGQFVALMHAMDHHYNGLTTEHVREWTADPSCLVCGWRDSPDPLEMVMFGRERKDSKRPNAKPCPEITMLGWDGGGNVDDYANDVITRGVAWVKACKDNTIRCLRPKQMDAPHAMTLHDALRDAITQSNVVTFARPAVAFEDSWLWYVKLK